MLRRLVGNDILLHREHPRRGQIRWWMCECRSPETLISLAQEFTRRARVMAKGRPPLQLALDGEMVALSSALAEEERHERGCDREHWIPLREELEQMSLQRPREG